MGDIANRQYGYEVFIGRTKLIEKSRFSPRTVDRALAELLKGGYLTPLTDPSPGKPVHYRFNFKGYEIQSRHSKQHGTSDVRQYGEGESISGTSDVRQYGGGSRANLPFTRAKNSHFPHVEQDLYPLNKKNRSINRSIKKESKDSFFSELGKCEEPEKLSKNLSDSPSTQKGETSQTYEESQIGNPEVAESEPPMAARTPHESLAAIGDEHPESASVPNGNHSETGSLSHESLAAMAGNNLGLDAKYLGSPLVLGSDDRKTPTNNLEVDPAEPKYSTDEGVALESSEKSGGPLATKDDAPVSKPRKRDLLFDAMAEAGGHDIENLTKAESKSIAVAKAQIRPLGATPEQVWQKADIYAKLHPTLDLTEWALVKHWSELTLEKLQDRIPTADKRTEGIAYLEHMVAQQRAETDATSLHDSDPRTRPEITISDEGPPVGVSGSNNEKDRRFPYLRHESCLKSSYRGCSAGA